MHLIRRSAARAIAAPFSSFKVASPSPAFLARSKTQSAISTSVFRRAYSDESRPTAADGEQSSVDNAVNTANESAPSNAYQDNAPREYQPRESRPFDNNRGGDRGGYGGRGGRSGGYGGDRGGGRPFDSRGGDRGGYGGDRGGRSGPPREFTPRETVPGPSVYVGNILFDVTAADLSREFAEFGTIKDVIIATDARGLSKGFGYVQFENQEQAAAAIEGKHQTVLEGRRLVVNYMTKSSRERPINPPSKTLFIGNLAFEMSDGDLNKLFREVANVVDVRVAIDRRTGQPRGFAHAEFVDTASAIVGKEALADKEVYGRKLRVDFSASSRESRGDRAAPRDSSASPGDDGSSA